MGRATRLRDLVVELHLDSFGIAPAAGKIHRPDAVVVDRDGPDAERTGLDCVGDALGGNRARLAVPSADKQAVREVQVASAYLLGRPVLAVQVERPLPRGNAFI